jgi:hypothetical protein
MDARLIGRTEADARSKPFNLENYVKNDDDILRPIESAAQERFLSGIVFTSGN